MRKFNPRFWLNVAAICLPTVVVLFLAVGFTVVEIPRIVGAERDRVASEVESAARDLLENPVEAGFVWRRGRGIVEGDASFAADFPPDRPWKDWVTSSSPKKREKWGFVDRPDGMVVWVRDTRKGMDDETVYGRLTGIREHDYGTVVRAFVSVSLIVLVCITAFAVKYFVDYVRSRDDFMAATAHDLTTPLVGMRMTIGRRDDEAKILNERMIRLVANIKDFMRLGGRRKDPELKPCDIAKCYDEAYSLFRDDYRAILGDDVEKSINGQIPPVMADETLLVQILWNILGNDLKYAAPYGNVSAAFRTEGGFVHVDFVDEGKGMTKKAMDRAFDRYYRAMTVLESGKGGFGIGLCTAREFARSMDGDLSVRANSPHGCVFTLSLPVAKVHSGTERSLS